MEYNFKEIEKNGRPFGLPIRLSRQILIIPSRNIMCWTCFRILPVPDSMWDIRSGI